MTSLSFSSSLPVGRQQELVQLMFFNLKQHQYRDAIARVIHEYGVPEVVVDGDALRFETDRLGTVQSIIATDGPPDSGKILGVALYYRIRPECLVLLHLGVRSEYAAGGSQSHEQLTLRLIEQIRRIGKSIRGVSRLEFLYGSGSRKSIAV